MFKIDDGDISGFMAKLLRGVEFDEFTARGVEVVGISRFEIDCILNREYAEEGTANAFCSWKQIKPYVFNIVKGSVKPKSIIAKISLWDTALVELHPNAAAAALNITYQNSEIICTTATSQKNFALDKSLDLAWENYVKEFFKRIEIQYQVVS